MTEPRISVIMSCYNAANSVDRAVESILNQTFINFEFIIINDGSTDDTFGILRKFAVKDERVMLLQNEKNIGLAASLNLGIIKASCSLIARMDSDDEAFPERLEKQFEYLSAHQEVDILGTAMVCRTKNNKLCGIARLPEQHQNIVKRIFRKPLLYHPTILIKKSVYLKYGMYDPGIRWAEDADLWYRIYDKVKLHNLSEPLLYYTVKDSLSIKQAGYNIRVKIKNLKERGLLRMYLPQLAKDIIIMGFKMTRYSHS